LENSLAQNIQKSCYPPFNLGLVHSKRKKEEQEQEVKNIINTNMKVIE